MKIPEIGKTYNCFDDGKIRESRLYTVKVEEVISFKDIDSGTLEQWKDEVKQCYWLYKPTTDYFIKTFNGADTEVFVRTVNEGWFSMGFMCSGRLDVDGTLMDILENKNEK